MAIRVRGVSKHYLMYQRPEDRLKQSIVPRLQRLIGQQPTQYYRDFAALHDISFDVGRGETIGVIGRNGCGKSTLLQIVCGTLQPTAGSVEVNGRIAALLELGAGFNPEFTGRENIFLNAAILGLPHAEIERRFDDIAGFADIGRFIDQPVKTYSSGMYVRLAFATAINVDPDILLVDEALAVGDEAFQRKCIARIEDIKDKGGTILFVSHSPQTVVQLCDRVLFIDAGELILEGRPKAVVSQYQRLVNASVEGAPEIRRSILRMRDDAVCSEDADLDQQSEYASLEAGDSDPVRLDLPPEGGISKPQPPAADDYSQQAFFDPDLKSQSAVELEPQGARIDNVRITTIDGKQANVLRMGRRYSLNFDVTFDVDATNVGCNIMLRTINGVAFAGVQSHLIEQGRGCSVDAGQTIRAQFEFVCNCLPGTYFSNARVMGRVGDEIRVMHRIVDAIAFKVLPEPDLLATGLIDIGASASVHPIK